MRNVKYMLFTLLFLFINTFYVQASCTNEDLTELRTEASKIKITYKHNGPIETDDFIDYNRFEVTVKNIPDNFYIKYSGDSETLVPNNGVAKTTLSNGNWNFKVYSNKCDEQISLIEVFLPRFNMYSLDPLCEGIDGDDFALCGKYYEYDVEYENFKDRVEHYRATYKIDSKNDDDNSYEKSYFNNIIEFIYQYKLYIIGFSVILLFIIILSIIMKRRKKRGVLK